MIITATTYVISDLHFGHEKMYTEFGIRPKDFNELLIKNWNETIKNNDDTVLFLGDLALEGSEATKEHTKTLHGKKLMLLGNHDHKSVSYYEDLGFRVIDPIYKVFVNSGGRFPVLFTHEPIVNLPNGWYNIHGHIHAGMHREYALTDRHFNVSVEAIEFTPIQICDILGYWKKEKILG